MKLVKISYMAVTLLFVLLLVIPSCQYTSRAFGIRTPISIADRKGHIIIVYEVYENNNRSVYIQKLGSNGQSFWDDHGIKLYSEKGNTEGTGVTALLENNADENINIIWEENANIRAQKMDIDGRFLWGMGINVTSNSVNGFKAHGDYLGGLIVAWSDIDGNLKLQHIGSNGTILWQTEDLRYNLQFFSIDVDNTGNTLIIWESKDSNIRVQKLDPDGKSCWESSGLPISELHNHGAGMSNIICDGAGGGIATWIHAVSTEKQAAVTNHELYTQRINSEGKTLWENGGVDVRPGKPEQDDIMPISPQIVSDNSEGAFITWRENMSIYTQRISATGAILWVQDDILVWDGEGVPVSPNFNTLTDKKGDIVIIWNFVTKGLEINQNHNLYAQCISSSGDKKWGENGIPVIKESPVYLTPAQVTLNNDEGIIVSWAGGEDIHNAELSFIQNISGDGALLWGDNGLMLK